MMVKTVIQKNWRMMAVKINHKKRKPPFISSLNNSLPIVTIDSVIALLPCIVWGVLRFGFNMLLSALFCIGVAAAVEFIYTMIAKCRYDYTVIICALVLSMCLAPSAPVYVAPIGGGIVGLLWVVRRFHGMYFTYEPLIIALAVVSLFVFQTQSPMDSVFMGSKVSGLTVMDLILGRHTGGWGSVSFVAILIGYVYLTVRKRISPIAPLAFILALILSVCLFYDSTDLITQLDYISYMIFDGKMVFAAVFILTLPRALPRFGRSIIISALICGALFGYILVTFKSCELLYPMLAVFSLCSRLVPHVRYRILKVNAKKSNK